MDIRELENLKVRRIEKYLHLRISLGIIHYTGTWLPEGKFRWLYMIYTVCSFTFMLGSFILSELVYFYIHVGDVPKMAAVGTILMTNSAHAYKFIKLISQQKRVQKLLDIAKGEIFDENNAKYEQLVSLYTWKGIFHHIAYQSFGTVAILCWGFSPVADLVSGRSRRLATEGWYPVNVTATPAYELITLHQALGFGIACFHDVGIDTLVTGLITIACCQFKLLEWNLATIDDVDEQNTGDDRIVSKTENFANYRTKEIYRRFKKCVEHNNIIYEFIRDIQSIFGTVIFVQFFVNCIIICLIAFHISQMKVYIPSVLIGMLTYMCCMTYQIFIYCWHGNELHLHAMDLTLANYSSNWFCGTKQFKRALQIMMIRTQSPLTLTAGNIMALSLDTFMGIIRTSYSIFTVLQSSTNN